MLDPALALRLFENGATIVFQGLHRTWLPLASSAASWTWPSATPRR